MQVSSNGRVRRSEGEWRQLMDRYAGSGLSRRAFCGQEQLNLTSFERWYRRLTEAPGVGFVEVTRAGGNSSSWVVEVELAGGTVVRVGR